MVATRCADIQKLSYFCVALFVGQSWVRVRLLGVLGGPELDFQPGQSREVTSHNRRPAGGGGEVTGDGPRLGGVTRRGLGGVTRGVLCFPGSQDVTADVCRGMGRSGQFCVPGRLRVGRRVFPGFPSCSV